MTEATTTTETASADSATPTAAEKKLNQYEAMFLVGPSDLEHAIGLCRSIIERHQGQIILIKKWDERRLAYELGGQKRGTYIIAYFRAPGAAVVGIERDVNLNEEVLRVLVTRADHLNEQEMAAVEPQPIQSREERPWEDSARGFRDRGDRGERGDRGDREGRSSRSRRERDESAPASGGSGAAQPGQAAAADKP